MRAILIPGLLMLAACDASDRLESVAGSAMGTTYSISFKPGPSNTAVDEIETDVVRLIEAIEAELSTYRPDSGVSRFNAAQDTRWQPVSSLVCESVTAALEMSRLTNGAFDVTVGPLVDLWGFGADGVTFEPPTDAAVEARLAFAGYEKLEADCDQMALRKAVPELRVDLSGWAKGFAIDSVAEHLDSLEISDYLVELGGEVRARGTNAFGEPWVIAIESPDASQLEIFAAVAVSDLSVATSGDYRNFFEYDGIRYSHILDPRTGRPTENELASVTIVHPSAEFADALATAVLVLGPDAGYALVQRERIAALLIVRGEEGVRGRETAEFSALRR